MKKIIISMVVMAMFAVMPASAQGIAFGVKGGWNFGIGAMLTKKIEVGVVYSLGIAKTGELEAEIDRAKANNDELKPKSSTVQVSATLFF